MPYAMVSWPSLGLSLLHSQLRRRGITSKVYYLNLFFSSLMSPEAYQALAIGTPNNTNLLGEWTFAEALWGADPGRDDTYLSAVLSAADRGQHSLISAELDACRQRGLTARAKVGTFLDRCMEAADWASIRIVGFTSVFQQHISSLALAKRLKAAFPHLYIIFGGANCQGEMGAATLRNFQFVDAVCCGEGDYAFPEFAEILLAGTIPHSKGILTRRAALESGTELPLAPSGAEGPPPIKDLDNLPFPDYGDYFEAIKNVPTSGILPIRMMFETSRGCWWGQKHHCTFCGLNAAGMSFRHKSPSRALEEILWLLDQYGETTRRLSAADNIIPFEYFGSFLPRLEGLNLDLELFYETKANLTEAQVSQYKRSGLSQIQPGIESMNSAVLTLMRKGISSLQNIQLLKWCAQYDVRPHWNYLFGFPGETPESYLGQPDLLSKIVHLTPPVGCGRVRFDRFSPYHNSPAEFGVTQLTPYPAYSYIYAGLTQPEISKLAYYFVGRFAGRSRSIPTPRRSSTWSRGGSSRRKR